MMMPEEMQPRLHRGEHLVDRRLAGIVARAPAGGADPERTRRLVREQDVHIAQARPATRKPPMLVAEPLGM